jgi:Na+-driven multidrug efflux pump
MARHRPLLSLTAMGLVDALFVGRLGTEELAAVGSRSRSCTSSRGAARRPAGREGGRRAALRAGDSAGLDRAAWTSFGLAAALGVLGLTASWWVLPVAHASGAPRAVAELAERYVLIRAHGAPLVFVFQAMQVAFQGRGNTRTPMAAVLISNVATIALEPFLIFGPARSRGWASKGRRSPTRRGRGSVRSRSWVRSCG